MELTISAQPQTMTSREIASLCEKEHRHVMRDVAIMLDQLQLDPYGYAQNWTHPQNQQTYVEYALPQDLTLTLVAGYSAPLRKRIIDRWMELEKASKSRELTRMELIQIAMDAEKENIQLRADLALAAPAVEFVGRYVESETGSMGFRQICKLLKAKEPEFRAFLHDNQIMYKLGGEWVPYAAHIDAGRFEMKTGTANEHAYSQSKFTPKGVEWIAGEWAKHQIKEAV
jgi:phage antirepressor YoqD-like protein